MDDVASHSPAHGLCEKFHRAVELIGARWTGALLQVLMQGPVRYADLRAAVPDISDRMLCERLRELEDQAIVVRTVSPEPPVRVDYELSAKGRALGPALAAIGRWAEVWAGKDERGRTKIEGRRTQSGTKHAERGTANSDDERPTSQRVRAKRSRAPLPTAEQPGTRAEGRPGSIRRRRAR